MIPHLDWRKMSREQKNAAFAERVAKTPPILITTGWVLDYLDSPNAVLPYLEKGPWNCSKCWPSGRYYVGVPTNGPDIQGLGQGRADTFCEAAMLALLRSAGAEVDLT